MKLWVSIMHSISQNNFLLLEKFKVVSAKENSGVTMDNDVER